MTAPVRPPVKNKALAASRSNGLAIQLSAFALSFTLVALLVVSGSQAAFVEPSKVLENYVPIGTAAPSEAEPSRPDGAQPRRPARRRHPDGTRAPRSALIEEPEPEPEPDGAPGRGSS